MSEFNNDAKKWVDLTEFGSKLFVLPATAQRQQMAVIQVFDKDLLQKRLNISLKNYLYLVHQTDSFNILNRDSLFSTDSDPIFLGLEPGKKLSGSLLGQIYPINESNTKNFNISDIYLDIDFNETQKNNWLNLLNKTKDSHFYQVQDQLNIDPKLNLLEAYQQFKAKTLNNTASNILETIDPLPLNDLSAYGYTASKSLVRFYSSKEAAIEAGHNPEHIHDYQSENHLIISMNADGEAIAFKDITKISEFSFYDLSLHESWFAYNDLPSHFNALHQLRRDIPDQLSKISLSLEDDIPNSEVLTRYLPHLKETIDSINNELYSLDPLSVSSIAAPFGISTSSLQFNKNAWEVWSYDNQTLETNEIPLKVGFDKLVQDFHTNVQKIFSSSTTPLQVSYVEENLNLIEKIASNLQPAIASYEPLQQIVKKDSFKEKLEKILSSLSVTTTSKDNILTLAINRSILNKINSVNNKKTKKIEDNKHEISSDLAVNTGDRSTLEATFIQYSLDQSRLNLSTSINTQLINLIELELSQHLTKVDLNALLKQSDAFLSQKEFNSLISGTGINKSKDSDFYFFEKNKNSMGQHLWNQVVSKHEVLYKYNPKILPFSYADHVLDVDSTHDLYLNNGLNFDDFGGVSSPSVTYLASYLASNMESVKKAWVNQTIPFSPSNDKSTPYSNRKLLRFCEDVSILLNGLSLEGSKKSLISENNATLLDFFSDEINTSTVAYSPTRRIEMGQLLLELNSILYHYNSQLSQLYSDVNADGVLNSIKGIFEKDVDSNKISNEILDRISIVYSENFNQKACLVKALAFCSNQSILDLPDSISSSETFYIDKSENYLPKLGLKKTVSADPNLIILPALNKKMAVSLSFDEYIKDRTFGDLNLSPLAMSDSAIEIKSIVMAAYNYMQPSTSESNLSSYDEKLIDTQYVDQLIKDSILNYIEFGQNLYLEKEEPEKAISVFSTSIIHAERYIKLLPTYLAQDYINTVLNDRDLSNGYALSHVVDVENTPDDLINIDLLSSRINSAILRENLTKHEILTKSVELFNQPDFYPSYLPLRIEAHEVKNRFDDFWLSKNFNNSTSDQSITIDDLVKESLKISIESKGSEYWKNLSQFHRGTDINTDNKSIFSDRLFIVLTPPVDDRQSAINLYSEFEKLSKNDKIVAELSLTNIFNSYNDVLNDDLSDFNKQLLNDMISERLVKNIQSFSQENKIPLLNENSSSYRQLKLIDQDGNYIYNSKASFDLVNYLKDFDHLETKSDLIDALNKYVLDLCDQGPLIADDFKIILKKDEASYKGEIVVDVLHPNIRILLDDDLFSFRTLNEFTVFLESNSDSIPKKSINELVISNIKKGLDLNDNVMSFVNSNINEDFNNLELSDLDRLIHSSLVSYSSKINDVYGSQIFNRMPYSVAIQYANDENPISVKFIDQNSIEFHKKLGYQVIGNGEDFSSSYPLYNVLSIVNSGVIITSREKYYLDQHIIQNQQRNIIEVQPLVSNTVDMVGEFNLDHPSADEKEDSNSLKLGQNLSLLDDNKDSSTGLDVQDKDTKIQDTGIKIPGAKKDLYGVRISLDQIQDMNMIQIKDLIARDKIWRKETFEAAYQAGRDIYIHILTDAVRKEFSKTPAYPSVTTSEDQLKQVATDYYTSVVTIRDLLMSCKSVSDLAAKSLDLFNEISSNQSLKKGLSAQSSSITSLFSSYRDYAIDLVEAFKAVGVASADSKPYFEEKLQELLIAGPKINAYKIIRKVDSFICSKNFKERLNGLDFSKHIKVYFNNTFFHVPPADLSEQAYNNILNYKKEKTTENKAVEEVNISAQTVSAILKQIGKDTDSASRKFFSSRNLRSTVNIKDLVVSTELKNRNGSDITAHTLQSTFGFKAVEFGEYLNQKDRQQALNFAYDGCFALTKALKIDAKMVGLNGLLGLAFGSRGRSAALAHYEPSHRVINLTKMSGFGTFAHEYFHALDHLVFDSITKDSPEFLTEKTPFVTALSRNHSFYQYRPKDISGLNKEIMEASDKVIDSMYYLPVTKLQTIDQLQEAIQDSVVNSRAVLIDIIKKSVKSESASNFFIEKLNTLDDRVNNFLRTESQTAAINRVIAEFSLPKSNPYFNFSKVFSEVDLLTKNEIYDLRSKMNSEDQAVAMEAAEILGTYDSTLFRSTIYHNLKGLVSDITSLEILDRLSKKPSDSYDLDKVKVFSYSLQSLKADKGLRLKSGDRLPTNYYLNARYLDAISGKAKPYWATAHEMFARAGEQYVFSKLAELNLRNDWLVSPLRGDSTIIQPMHKDKDSIISSMDVLLDKAFTYVADNIAELRFRDHRNFVKESMHYFPPESSQFQLLVDWGKKLDSMTQEQYDQYWDEFIEAINTKSQDVENNHEHAL